MCTLNATEKIIKNNLIFVVPLFSVALHFFIFLRHETYSRTMMHFILNFNFILTKIKFLSSS